MNNDEFKIKERYCPFNMNACDKRCPAWTKQVTTIENIVVYNEKTGFCYKLDQFNDDGKLYV